MQLQRQHTSEGGEGFSSNENRGAAKPHNKSRVSHVQMQPQSQQQQQPPESVIAAARESKGRLYHRSNSCDIGRKSDNTTPTKQKQLRYSDSTSPDCRALSESGIQAVRRLSSNASDRKRPEPESESITSFWHVPQLPFGPRSKPNATPSFVSPLRHKKPYSGNSDFDSTLSRPLSSRSSNAQHVEKRSHLPRQNIFSFSENVHVISPRPMLKKPHTSDADAAVPVTPHRLSERRTVDAATTSQLRKLCMDAVKSAEAEAEEGITYASKS